MEVEFFTDRLNFNKMFFIAEIYPRHNRGTFITLIKKIHKYFQK